MIFKKLGIFILYYMFIVMVNTYPHGKKPLEISYNSWLMKIGNVHHVIKFYAFIYFINISILYIF